MHPRLTTTVPLEFATLEPEERALCSVILYEVAPVKMFALFGPVTYQQNYIRYHGHLTTERLILEIMPYTAAESLAVKATSFVGKYASPAQATALGAQFALAKLAMSDPDRRVLSIPYGDIASVELVKSLGIGKHVKIRRRGQDDLCFNVSSTGSAELTLDPAQWKRNYEFTDDFVEYVRTLVRERRRPQA